MLTFMRNLITQNKRRQPGMPMLGNTVKKSTKKISITAFLCACCVSSILTAKSHSAPDEVALNFGSGGGYVEITDFPDLSENGEIAFSFWFKPDGLPFSDWSRIMQKEGRWHGPLAFVEKGGNNVRVGVGEGNNNPFITVSLDADDWVHIAGTLSDGTFSAYKNGTFVDSMSGVDFDDSERKLYLGREVGPNNAYYLYGTVNDFRIYDNALSSSEIRQLYEEPYRDDVAPEKAVAWWPMNEGGGNILEDRAQDHDGRIVGDSEVVLERPFEVDLPSELEAEPGETITLGPVELRNPEGEVQYQWYFDDEPQWYFTDEPIEGATGNELEITHVSAEHTGEYHVIVNDERELTPVKSQPLHLHIAD